MKRLFAVLLAAVMLFSMAACDNLKVETIEPTPMPPVETEAPAEEPAVTECPRPEIVGPWELAMEKNEYAAILEYFGTSVREVKPTMEICSNGDFSYTLGASGGYGTWSPVGDYIEAVYTTWNDEHEETVTIDEIEDGGTLYLHMQIGGIEIVWRQESEDSGIDGEALYADVLAKYRQALAERWDTVKLSDEGVDFMLVYAVSDDIADPLAEVGYYFEDISGDGMPELFIGFMDENDMSVLSIYTVDTETMEKVEVAFGGERFNYHVAEDHGRIFFHGSSSAFCTVDYIYRLEGTELMLLESVVYDSDEDANNPWKHNGETVSEEEAMALLNGIESEYVKLPLKAFAD